jgi:hypothetical protein
MRNSDFPGDIWVLILLSVCLRLITSNFFIFIVVKYTAYTFHPNYFQVCTSVMLSVFILCSSHHYLSPSSFHFVAIKLYLLIHGPHPSPSSPLCLHAALSLWIWPHRYWVWVESYVVFCCWLSITSSRLHHFKSWTLCHCTYGIFMTSSSLGTFRLIPPLGYYEWTWCTNLSEILFLIFLDTYRTRIVDPYGHFTFNY